MKSRDVLLEDALAATTPQSELPLRVSLGCLPSASARSPQKRRTQSLNGGEILGEGFFVIGWLGDSHWGVQGASKFIGG